MEPELHLREGFLKFFQLLSYFIGSCTQKFSESSHKKKGGGGQKISKLTFFRSHVQIFRKKCSFSNVLSFRALQSSILFNSIIQVTVTSYGYSTRLIQMNSTGREFIVNLKTKKKNYEKCSPRCNNNNLIFGEQFHEKTHKIVE